MQSATWVQFPSYARSRMSTTDDDSGFLLGDNALAMHYPSGELTSLRFEDSKNLGENN